MAKLSGPSPLTASHLLLRGVFHDRIIPPLSTLGLNSCVNEIVNLARDLIRRRKPSVRARCVQHSVPKSKHLRRVLSIPNPLQQSVLCCEVADNWKDLWRLCKESPFSLSMPHVSTKRALESEHDRKWVNVERARRSVGARYVLSTDIARFYPSIYTHSIGWAVHGKAEARADNAHSLYGNRIDRWVRETQDRQTGGIPIGPDTSFLIAEVVASRLDKLLQTAFTSRRIRGTRYIDDYNLYFLSLSDAEKALAVLHGAARQFELDINDAKTEIREVPEPLEPYWKTQLRGVRLRSGDHSTSLKALFDRASELSKQFPQDSVFTYVAKQVLSAEEIDDWTICEALLMRSSLGEPSMLPWVLQIYQKHEKTKSAALAETIDSLCGYHSQLQQGSEVAWALWFARALNVELSHDTAVAVTKVDDDLVAIVALDLMAEKLLPKVRSNLWESHMNPGALYSDHWLLAYEAYEQGWLQPEKSGDYIAADQHGCYAILRKNGVRFYDPDTQWDGGFPNYSDDDDDDDGEEDEDEDNLTEENDKAI
jgi:hypothetical protein